MADARRPALKEMSIPFQFNAAGGVAYETSLTRIYGDHIKMIVMTALNERAMRPDYGSQTRTYLFENADDTLAQELATRLQDALERWEPNVQIVHVRPIMHAVTEGILEIEVAFRVPPSSTINTVTSQVVSGVESSTSQGSF